MSSPVLRYLVSRHVVLRCVVWCRVVWCQVVLGSVAWCRVVWCQVVLGSVAWCRVVWCFVVSFWGSFLIILGIILTSLFHIIFASDFDRIFLDPRCECVTTPDSSGFYPANRGIPSPASKIDGAEEGGWSFGRSWPPSAAVFSRSVFSMVFQSICWSIWHPKWSQNQPKIYKKSMKNRMSTSVPFLRVF